MIRFIVLSEVVASVTMTKLLRSLDVPFFRFSAAWREARGNCLPLLSIFSTDANTLAELPKLLDPDQQPDFDEILVIVNEEEHPIDFSHFLNDDGRPKIVGMGAKYLILPRDLEYNENKLKDSIAPFLQNSIAVPA